MYHSTLGSRVIKKKKDLDDDAAEAEEVADVRAVQVRLDLGDPASRRARLQVHLQRN